MNPRRRQLALALAALAGACAVQPPAPSPEAGPSDKPSPTPLPDRTPRALPDPPLAPREFRAAWVASVANIDWPSRPGLSTGEQIEEMRRIVERATTLKLNALILQVRPAADALYESSLEPWSEYLTGEQGRAPAPYYDPLRTWIDACHARGIELHAWFNPYRARHSSAKSPAAPTHVSRQSPAIAKPYGDLVWMDPGEPEAARRTLDVILDVVRRYDIDGVHMDDYFYPYPVAKPGGGEVEFPDGPAWQRYQRRGGKLSRADWRRQNVNELVERLHDRIARTRPGVRFGISPFGLPRPDRRPPGITGFSQYDKLFADVELWVEKGWLDYLAPQLYWPRDQLRQAFGPLLTHWARANPMRRHVWPGLFTSRIDDTPKSWVPEEILAKVAATRVEPGIGGHIHFSAIALLQNRRGIADRLARDLYASATLVPATPWLGDARPPVPRARVTRNRGSLEIAFDAPAREDAWLLAVWAWRGERWHFSTHAAQGGRVIVATGQGADAVQGLAASFVSRTGIEGPVVRLAVPLETSRG